MAEIGSIKSVMNDQCAEALRDQVMEAANGVLSLGQVSSFSMSELKQFMSGDVDVRDALITQAQQTGMSDAAKREYDKDLDDMLHWGMTSG